MEVLVWQMISWSYVSKRPRRVLFHLVPHVKKWKVSTIELFDDNGIPIGEAFPTSFDVNTIRQVERKALKMHGAPKARDENIGDPMPDRWRKR